MDSVCTQHLVRRTLSYREQIAGECWWCTPEKAPEFLADGVHRNPVFGLSKLEIEQIIMDRQHACDGAIHERQYKRQIRFPDEPLACKKCDWTGIANDAELTSTSLRGIRRVRADCRECGAYIKWLTQ